MRSLFLLFSLLVSLTQCEPNVQELLSDDESNGVHGLPGPNGTDDGVHHLFGASGGSCGSGQTSYYLPQSGSMPSGMPAPRISCNGYSLSNCQICAPASPYYAAPGATNNFRISVYCPSTKLNTYTTWESYGSSSITGSYSSWPQADFIGQVSCARSSDYGWVRYEWCDGSSNYGSWVMQYQSGPQCYPSCANNTCGGDGCGGYCNCASGYTCTNSQCVRNCVPYCGYNTCGSDGCGGTCTSCQSGYTCTSGQCVANCYPSCGSNTCGSDGCGGNCGSCSSGYTCTGGQCVRNCVPSCSYNTCGSDGCGGTCGSCQSGYTCTSGQCVHNCVPSCGYNTCGSNGCGGTCSNCTTGYSCSSGQCVANCYPSCGSNTCGSNGCGGTCGTCSSGYTCTSGQCVHNCVPSCGYNTCGSNGCGGTCSNCTTGYSCSSGQCVSNCVPTCGYNTCGSDGCGGTCNSCASGYTCSGSQCVANCVPTCGYNTCGSDGCGGTCNSCGSGYYCSNSQCVANTPAPSSYPSCGAGRSPYFLPQTNGLPLPTDMGASDVSCSKYGTSPCQICSPPSPIYLSTTSSYGYVSQNFTISVYCPQNYGSGNKQTTYASWMTYGSASLSAQFSAWPQADLTVSASVRYSTDHGWVRYEWCDNQGYPGAWVTQFQGLAGPSAPSTCYPSCGGKSCGSDGCGGSCGTCYSPYYCLSSGSCGY